MSDEASKHEEEQINLGATVASEMSKAILHMLETHSNILKMISPQIDYRTKVGIALTAIGLAKSSLVAAIALSGMVATSVEEYMDNLADGEKNATLKALEKVAAMAKAASDPANVN